MRRGSITAGCAITAIVVALSVVKWADQPRAATTDPELPIDISAGTPYVVPVSAGKTQFDLDLAGEQSYLLIIGSLG